MKIITIVLLIYSFLNGQVIHQIDFDRFTHYEKDDWISYGYSNSISSIDIGFNNVYLSTYGGGILVYDLYRNEWKEPLTSSNGLRNNIVQIVVYNHKTNKLFAKTRNGIDVYNEAFEYWEPTSAGLPQIKSPQDIENNNILPAFSRPPVEKWPTFFPDRNYDIMLDGTFYDPDNQKYTFGDRVVDNWDRMWLATNGAGVAIADLQTLEIKFVKQSIPAIYPKDVFVSGDNIWIGGDPFNLSERGITHWNYEQNKWTYYKSGFDFNIFSDKITVIEKCAGNLFFGTEQGLLMFNPKKREWKNLQRIYPIKNDAVNDLCSINNTLYIATENGLFSYNVKSGSAQQIGERYIKQTRVNSLTRIKSVLYIATNYGIFKYNSKDDNIELLKSRAAIPDNFIESIAADRHTLWFSGTSGIGFYDTIDDKWQSFPALKYELSSKINHIALTHNNAWFATNDGLLKYDTTRDHWYLYTTEDGLTDNRVYRIETDGDYLWLATHGGVTLFCWNREGRIE